IGGDRVGAMACPGPCLEVSGQLVSGLRSILCLRERVWGPRGVDHHHAPHAGVAQVEVDVRTGLGEGQGEGRPAVRDRVVPVIAWGDHSAGTVKSGDTVVAGWPARADINVDGKTVRRDARDILTGSRESYGVNFLCIQRPDH